MSLVPEFRWAENDEKVFLTIEVSDAKDVKVSITTDAFSFSGKNYKLDFKFKKSVNAEKSSYAVRDRGVEVLLVKAEPGFWLHLLADKNLYKNRVKIDWDLWKDEDDDDEKKPAANFGMGGGGDDEFGGFDPSSMGGGGGFPGGGFPGGGFPGGAGGFPGGPQGDDSDDEDLPDLEDAKDGQAGAKKEEDDDESKAPKSDAAQ